MDCKNCGINLISETNFCNNCGAKVIHNRLTVRNIFEDFSEQFLNYDNKFLLTFTKLFTDPNDVIGGYINGARKKYVNVISYFAIAITFSGIQIFIINKFFPEVMDLSAISAEGTEEFSNRNLQFINEYQSIIMMLNIPVYAFLAKLVFLKKKKFNYTELMVIFAYILSQISIIGAVYTIICAAFGITLGYSEPILGAVLVLYSAYCLKKLYGLTMKGILLRTLLCFVIVGVFFTFVSIVAGIFMIKNGAFKELIEAQKSAKEISYNNSSAINWTS